MDLPVVPEGHVGRARGEYAGMFVQVERDPTDAGWHLWLSDADPRDGPSPDGWDVWADEDRDVWEWLGPDCLDVEWFAGEAAPRAVEELLASTGADWLIRRVTAAGIESWLHDAGIALGEVELAGPVAVVPGMADSLSMVRPRRGRGSRTFGRSPFVLMAEPAEDVEIDDEQRINHLLVGDVRYAPAERMLIITSPIPGQVVRVHTGATHYYLASSREPTLVRAWGRWRQADPRPDDSGLFMTESGPIGTTCYSGPPQVRTSPGRKSLGRMGLPEPYETIETRLNGLSAAQRHRLTAELVSAFEEGDAPALLHRHGFGRHGWDEVERGADAGAHFLASFNTDDWRAGEVALFVRGHRGPAILLPAGDAELLIVVGGYRSRGLRTQIADLVAKALSDYGPSGTAPTTPGERR